MIRKTILYASLLVGMLWAGATYAQQPTYSRVRVHLQGHSMQEVQVLGLECDHGHYRPHTSWESDLSSNDLALLRQRGFQCDVLIEDVSQYYQLQNGIPTHRNANTDCNTAAALAYPTPNGFHLGNMGGYLTYTELLAELDSMCSRYPNLITCKQVIDSTTTTHEGRYLYWVKISDNPYQNETTEPQALYTALHHAREPLGLSQLVFYMWYLLENYNTNSEIRYLLNNTELYFLPCVNPDGYIYNNTNSPSGGGLWRKNRRNNGDGTYGVDLNRNYGYAFAYDNVGSSGSTNSETYRGVSGFSEPETRNVKKFCEERNIKMSLNYHTYGNLLIYPWAYNSAATPDSTTFQEFSAYMVRENNYAVGSNLSTVGYNTNGDADDWLYGEQNTKNKVLAMTPEAGAQQYGFYPPSAQIEPLCRSLMWQNLALPRFLLNYAELTEQSSHVWTTFNNQIVYDIKRYGFDNQGFTVRILPISNNIASVGAARNYTLTQFQTQRDSITVTLASNIQAGDLITLVLELDNGSVVHQDTIYRVFGSMALAFADTTTTAWTDWTNLGTSSTWGITTAAYYSSPSSITDSPTGDYVNNKTSEVILSQTFDFRNVLDATLSFWVKWDIEQDYDYAQVLASDSMGTFTPLCGLYTNSGTADQLINQPLYDGTQATWVREEISLRHLVGQRNVSIKFRMVSDAAVRADGFYFDDLEVRVLNAPPINVKVIDNEYNSVFELPQNQPNPANYVAYIPLTDWEFLPNTSLVVYNALRQVVHSQLIENQQQGVVLQLQNWADGVYFYQLQHAHRQSNTRKMVVQH